MIKLTVLAEETSNNPALGSEHGLSIYIETKKHNILFDFGQTELFASNAEKLGVDLSRVDIAFLSHAHYDHSGGIKAFLKLNDKAMIYANRRVTRSYAAADGRNVGVDPEVFNSGRFVFTDDELKIDDELTLFTANKENRPYYMSNYGLLKESEGGFIADDFLHEQYLLIDNETLISGCSHKGIMNILSWCRPKTAVGGMHLMKIELNEAGRAELARLAELIRAQDAAIYTCHCTGKEQFDYIAPLSGGKVRYIATGDSVTI